jgi:eukaryotic-like serine/threonine-protein kinase
MKSKDSKALSIDPTSDGIEDAVVTAAKQYLQLLDLDQAPSIDQFCAQHSAIAVSLRPALEGLAMVHRKEIVSPGIDNDTLGAPPGSRDHETLGKPIGDFQIVGELGRGGSRCLKGFTLCQRPG